MSVYNGEKTVGKAIESILNQTYKNFEFIVIDDRSQDQTLQILYNYQKQDSRIKILKNDKNLGIAESLNKGILEAKGEWIARMDDDDESLPDRLEKQIDYIKNHPDVDIFGGKAIFRDIHGNEMPNYFNNWPPINTNDIEKFLYHNSPIIHPTVFIRKQSLFNLGLYNKDFSGAEDYELWTRAWKNKLNIRNLDDILIRYTVNPEKKSFKRIWKRYYVKNYIIKQYNFPKRYYYYNLIILMKHILKKINLYNPIRHISNFR